MSDRYADSTEPVIPQQSAPFPSFRARSTSSSTVNANRTGTFTPTPAPNGGGGITSPAWLNALSDGLSWIESSKAAEKAAKGAVGIAGIGMGVGESIRDGLTARLAAAGGGGEARRPLSFTGWGTHLPGAGSTASGGDSTAGSTGRASIDETAAGTSTISLPVESPDHLQLPPQARTHRPSSFLEYIRPSPPTPPKRVSVSGAINVHHEPTGTDRNASTSIPSPKPPPKPSAIHLSSSPPVSTGTAPTPQRRRLGPPQPANMARLGSTQSVDSDIAPNPAPANGNNGSPAAQRFLRSNAHRSAHSLSYSGTGQGTSLTSLPRSASSSTYSLQEQNRNQAATPDGNGTGLIRSASSGLNKGLHPPSNTSGTSTPVYPQSGQRSRSHSLMQVQTVLQPQRAPSISRSSLGASQTPYRPGFQPAGVKTYRTEEFLEARNRKLAEISKEEGRLGRRWGKVNIVSWLCPLAFN